MREYAKKLESQSCTLDRNPKASRQAPIDVILQRYKERNIQRYAGDEELIQGKFDTAQCKEIGGDKLLQGKLDSTSIAEQEPVQQEEKPNNTGLPDNLKTGIENLSEYSMDDVKVYYNSPKPAQLQALAYTQGSDIHVAPEEEKHLPHEAWHVVQQKQGRVQPTMQVQGVNLNDNEGLVSEADVMGERAKFSIAQREENIESSDQNSSTIQCISTNMARIKALFKRLNYDQVVLPALNTYFLKRYLVDGQPLQTIEGLSDKEYSVFLNQLAAIGDYSGASFITEGVWYRGFGLVHYSYKVFKETGGILSGEGLDDTLVWTMGGSTTRWMPGSTNIMVCAGAALSLVKHDIYRATIGGHPNIAGIIVKKALSTNNPAFYLNDPASECGIRGPQKVELAYLVDYDGNMIEYNNIVGLPAPRMIT
ncbi:DUF4157 domain-containing protein [Parabacteroides sp. APC149_11_2_Y6]